MDFTLRRSGLTTLARVIDAVRGGTYPSGFLTAHFHLEAAMRAITVRPLAGHAAQYLRSSESSIRAYPLCLQNVVYFAAAHGAFGPQHAPRGLPRNVRSESTLASPHATSPASKCSVTTSQRAQQYARLTTAQTSLLLRRDFEEVIH
jgi:hypothetical protein